MKIGEMNPTMRSIGFIASGYLVGSGPVNVVMSTYRDVRIFSMVATAIGILLLVALTLTRRKMKP